MNGGTRAAQGPLSPEYRLGPERGRANQKAGALRCQAGKLMKKRSAPRRSEETEAGARGCLHDRGAVPLRLRANLGIPARTEDRVVLRLLGHPAGPEIRWFHDMTGDVNDLESLFQCVSHDAVPQ